MSRLFCLLLLTFLIAPYAFTQSIVRGLVSDGTHPVANAAIKLDGSAHLATTNDSGKFELLNIPHGKLALTITADGFNDLHTTLNLPRDAGMEHRFKMSKTDHEINEVVVTGTLRETRRGTSPVPVEIISAQLFRKNPTPNLFEALAMVNGVRAQTTCNVCNTGEIRINGMDGPYTMVLIDGMPIVSALSTVYGLNGIPNSLVDRIEVVKGPASALYGTEAMGGIINVITRSPDQSPKFSADTWASTWGEVNTDMGASFKAGKARSLLGLNYFNYQQPKDLNRDGFTDLALQQRVSLFNKWQWRRAQNRQASVAARYVYEDRWGGDMRWQRQWRGSDSIYGESIYTARVEMIASYQLPLREKILLQASYNWHDQDSYYGMTPFMASQQVFFAQGFWDKKLSEHQHLVIGASFRNTLYDDNTPATADANGSNRVTSTPLPGVFVQDEWVLNAKNTLLFGYRVDHQAKHGWIHSPRLAWKWSPVADHTFRFSVGSGFRVVNLFTEDHAALTGSRTVVIAENLRPERSWNGNLNYNNRLTLANGWMSVDATGFYSYFTNRIIGDFDSDPNAIIYRNLKGHSVSRGISLNVNWYPEGALKLSAGTTFLDVYYTQTDSMSHESRRRQLYAPIWSGNFSASYSFPRHMSIDLTGQFTGPMRLPVQPMDYRSEYSPWYTLLNIQAGKRWHSGVEIYGGVKNILNFLPVSPIMRPQDPFDKQAGNVAANPNGYTFDTGYNYAPLQGARGYIGIRYTYK